MKPILFSTPMVQAILAGRKTQTRRVIKPQPDDEGYISAVTNRGEPSKLHVHDRGLAPYRAGETLWVRETWGVGTRPDPMRGWIDGIEYKADESLLVDKYDDLPLYPFPDIDLSIYEGSGWRPSIHMPQQAARIFLRVTGVRAERVQRISKEDAIAEGVSRELPTGLSYKYYTGAFVALWDSLNAKRGYGWDKNPWVWVYEFERVEDSI